MQSVPPFSKSIFIVRYKTGRDYRVPPLSFFGTVRLFFENFFCPQRVPLSSFLIFCNGMYVNKCRRVPLLHFSALCDFFERKKFFKNLNFFSNKNLLRIFSLRYGADFRRSRLVARYTVSVGVTYYYPY